MTVPGQAHSSLVHSFLLALVAHCSVLMLHSLAKCLRLVRPALSSCMHSLPLSLVDCAWSSALIPCAPASFSCHNAHFLANMLPAFAPTSPNGSH